MITLITGGSASGKSAFGEEFMLRLGNAHRYYLATMQVYDDEGQKKVERHRMLRAGKGFVTIEQPVDIRQAAAHMCKEDSAALLECMSNLAANEMFRDGRICTEDAVADKIVEETALLAEGLTNLVIISNNIFEDGIGYDEGTMCYLRALGAVNQRLAALADEVYEVVAGIPIKCKGMEKCD